MVATVTGSNEASLVWPLDRAWLPLVERRRARSLTSGSAAPPSAPSADAWPPRSGYWPAPSDGPASSPPPSSHSEWDKRAQLSDPGTLQRCGFEKCYTYMQDKYVSYSFYMAG